MPRSSGKHLNWKGANVKDSEARAVVGALVSGFPQAKIPRETVELFTAQIAKLQSFEAATKAVEGLLLSQAWFPALAVFREAYGIEAKRIHDSQPQLEEPKLTNEERAAIVKEAQRWLLAREVPEEDLTVTLPPGGSGVCDDCAKQHEQRYVYGVFTLCAGCALPRMRVRTDLDEAEKRPVVARASGPPVPQPNFKRMPDHKRGEPANEAWFGKAYR